MLYLVSVLFLVFSLRSIFTWVYMWQLKEYRFDRLSVHLKDTLQGRRIFFSFESLGLWALILIFLSTVFSDALSGYYSYLVTFFLLALLMQMWQDMRKKRFKYPVPTAKAMGIVLLSYGTTVALSFLPLTDKFLWIVIMLLLTPLFVAFFVFLAAFPTEVYTDFLIQKAKKKRQHLKKLVVIAVSGSYGKSSTKEAIAYMLSSKYRVVKTSFSNNTPIAIARTILDRVYEDTDFFVVELGAYKKGEIAQLADMVGPTISVTTAVSDQHVALYGTIQDVIASEKELFQFLPKKGLALVNVHNEYAKTLLKHVRHSTIQYSTPSSSSIHARLIEPTRHGVRWEYMYKKDRIQLKSPLLGIHTVENLLPAVFLAKYFQLSDKEIQRQIATLRPLPKTMEKKKILDGITAIDDSFNASPESVTSAVAFLRLFPKRKILVLSPLIELGKNAKKRHYEIGKLLRYVDDVYVVNQNFYNEIKKGLEDAHAHTALHSGSYSEIAMDIRRHVKKNDCILFEGKEAGIVLLYLS